MPEKVLLIEDDHSFKPIFSAIFKTINPRLKLEWVADAESALNKMEKMKARSMTAPYKLIIADIFLDGEATGIDFLNSCQNIYPEIPVVVMSGISLMKFMQLLGTGVACPVFLEKPLNILECKAVLQRILAEQTAAEGENHEIHERLS